MLSSRFSRRLRISVRLDPFAADSLCVFTYVSSTKPSSVGISVRVSSSSSQLFFFMLDFTPHTGRVCSCRKTRTCPCYRRQSGITSAKNVTIFAVSGTLAVLDLVLKHESGAGKAIDRLLAQDFLCNFAGGDAR